uniref:Uncharacterized protein n=1 Tax=Knipowitschia caucasica TaxID=637954 RepID=A0AAV2MNC4_KNICA
MAGFVGPEAGQDRPELKHRLATHGCSLRLPVSPRRCTFNEAEGPELPAFRDASPPPAPELWERITFVLSDSDEHIDRV